MGASGTEATNSPSTGDKNEVADTTKDPVAEPDATTTKAPTAVPPINNGEVPEEPGDEFKDAVQDCGGISAVVAAVESHESSKDQEGKYETESITQKRKQPPETPTTTNKEPKTPGSKKKAKIPKVNKKCDCCSEPFQGWENEKYCSPKCQEKMRKEKKNESARNARKAKRAGGDTPTGGIRAAKALKSEIVKILSGNIGEDSKAKEVQKVVEEFGVIPEIIYNSKPGPRKEILETVAFLVKYTGAVVLRKMVPEDNCEMMLLHAQQLSREPDPVKNTTISGFYKEISLRDDPYENMTAQGSGLQKALVTAVEPLKSVAAQGFGWKLASGYRCTKHPFGGVGLMYIKQNAKSPISQPLHADSGYQCNMKGLIALSREPMVPTDYIPYTMLGNGITPLDKEWEKSGGEVDCHQMRARFGPVFESQNGQLDIYRQGVRKSVLKPNEDGSPRMMEKGDCLLFCGDFVHGGPGNKGGSERHNLFVSFQHVPVAPKYEKQVEDRLDMQMHPGSYAEFLYPKRGKRFTDLCLDHLVANGIHASEYSFYIDAWFGLKNPENDIKKDTAGHQERVEKYNEVKNAFEKAKDESKKQKKKDSKVARLALNY